MTMLNQTKTDAAKSLAEVATVFVYGYGAGKNPFYKDARGKKLNAGHWSLLLSAPVSQGQKLLLIDATGQNTIAGEIVTMRQVGGQMFEVAVALR
jgi:hypothetical protein